MPLGAIAGFSGIVGLLRDGGFGGPPAGAPAIGRDGGIGATP